MQQAKYELGQEVQFLGDTYKIVEVLAEGSSLHIKKVDAPFNTMVIPTGKLNTEDTLNDIEKAFKNSEENEDLPDFVEPDYYDIKETNPDLLYRPDDRISLEVDISPETQAALDEIKKEDE